MKFNSVIILCGGKGTRLGALSKKSENTSKNSKQRNTLVFN